MAEFVGVNDIEMLIVRLEAIRRYEPPSQIEDQG